MFKVLYRYLFILSLACVQLPAYADSGESLTVDKLIAQGYVLVQGEQLMQVFQMRKLAVSDIETGEVFILEGDRQKTGKNDRVEKVTSASPEKMFDPELTARPPMLRNARYQIRNDMIIATDGVRSYRLRFYMKGDTLYGARDVDAGNVYFKVVPTE
mgnify:CR=1 FL=1